MRERQAHGANAPVHERSSVVIALIDYGAGNLTSVRKGFRAAGAELTLASSPQDLHKAAGIVVPGVGNFAATAALDAEWRDVLERRVTAGVPLFGICLGMQWLFEGSDEAENVPGLGVLPGRCFRIRAERPLKVPHVGWNTLDLRTSEGILDGIDEGTSVYFTHSYAAPITAACVASSTHGEPFAAVVAREHVAGVQFHPEKSGQSGIRILRNFVRLTER